MEGNNKVREIPYGKNILVNCPNCGFKGSPKKYRKGNTILEIILRLLFLIPGAIYTARRHINTFCVCPKCNQTYLSETDGDDNLVDTLYKIQKKQVHGFWLIVILFVFLGFISLSNSYKGNTTRYLKIFNNQTQNNTYIVPKKIEEQKVDIDKIEENVTLSETKEEVKEETKEEVKEGIKEEVKGGIREEEPKKVKIEEPRDLNDEVREKMKDILKQIDYKYGEDIRLKQPSYIGASCSGDCINGIIDIKFGENIGWYDFTVEAHSADWSNKIIRAIPGFFDKLQINFICKGQTICSCTFTEYQVNSYAPKGCTYYGYKE